MTRCYAWPLTVRAGENLRLHVSTGHPRFGVRLLRVTATARTADGRMADGALRAGER
jgi:hypothetical protein